MNDVLRSAILSNSYKKMNKLFFIAILCCCGLSSSASESENKTWEEEFNKRFEILLKDEDAFNRFPNLSFHIIYYNVTEDLNGFHKEPHLNDQIIQENCYTTNIATTCSQVNIFEVVETVPPTTQYLEITNSPVQVLRQPILRNLTRLTHLKLTNNSIQYITSKFFIGLDNLRILNLSDNNIRALTKVAFSGCPKLITLDLSRNRIITLTTIPAAFQLLHNLTTLILSGNLIRRIWQNDLVVLRNSPLKSLHLSHCPLSIIERGSFSHLNYLEELILKVATSNEVALSNATYDLPNIRDLDLRLLYVIKRFPSEAMLNLANSTIEYIDFSLTEFSFIPSTAFPELPNLKKLRFSGSLISEIENGAFDGLTSLQFLDLTSNRISIIPRAISVLQNLVFLSLSKQNSNNFKIPDYSLSNLTSLTVLKLEKTQISSEISRFSLHGLSNLTHLVMYSCGIYLVKDKAFETLSSLKLLELSYNKIFSLMNETLKGLHNLDVLGLRSNGLIIGLNNRPFMHTKSLKKLLLPDNKLVLLKPGIFSGMKHLEIMNLSGNSIVPWNFSIFKDSAPQSLLLRNNEISYATPAMLEDFEQASHVDVSLNPFDCRRCEIEDFREWLLNINDTYHQDVDDDELAYNCFSPPDVFGYSIFESDFHLDHCYPPAFPLEIRIAIGFSTSAACMVLLIAFGYYFRWYFRYWWFHIHASIKRLSTSSSGNPYLYDAFVSYNSVDITWVKQKLIPNLESRNSQIRLCLHDRDFEVGRLITENILESIDKSRKVLLVLTNAFLQSEWCLFELHVAQHRLFHDTRDALVLIQVEPLQKDDASKHLRYLMKTRTLLVWPDKEEKQEAFWTSLNKILSS